MLGDALLKAVTLGEETTAVAAGGLSVNLKTDDGANGIRRGNARFDAYVGAPQCRRRCTRGYYRQKARMDR